MDNLITLQYENKVDEKVKEELRIAGIPVITIRGGYIKSDVKTKCIGILNGFVFCRADCYWDVEGEMPLEYADYIFKNFKDMNIRAGSNNIDNENPKTQVHNESYLQRIREHKKKCDSFKIFMKTSDKIEEDIPGDKKYIKYYRVDTQLGLCKLAEVIRENNIITELK